MRFVESKKNDFYYTVGSFTFFIPFGEGFIRTTTQTHTCLSFSARPPRCGRRRRPHRRDDDDDAVVVVMVVVVVFEEDTTKDDDDVIHGEDSKL